MIWKEAVIFRHSPGGTAEKTTKKSEEPVCGPRFEPDTSRIYLASVSRPAMGPTQPHTQWVLGRGGPFPRVTRSRYVTLTTHPT
jgi:hypothetical protein